MERKLIRDKRETFIILSDFERADELVSHRYGTNSQGYGTFLQLLSMVLTLKVNPEES